MHKGTPGVHVEVDRRDVLQIRGERIAAPVDSVVIHGLLILLEDVEGLVPADVEGDVGGVDVVDVEIAVDVLRGRLLAPDDVAQELALDDARLVNVIGDDSENPIKGHPEFLIIKFLPGKQRRNAQVQRARNGHIILCIRKEDDLHEVGLTLHFTDQAAVFPADLLRIP